MAAALTFRYFGVTIDKIEGIITNTAATAFHHYIIRQSLVPNPYSASLAAGNIRKLVHRIGAAMGFLVLACAPAVAIGYQGEGQQTMSCGVGHFRAYLVVGQLFPAVVLMGWKPVPSEYDKQGIHYDRNRHYNKQDSIR